MKTTHLMRLVAILLCTVLIFEDPMTALASSNAVTSDSVSADETNDIEASQESTDTPDTAAAGSYKNEGSVKTEADTILWAGWTKEFGTRCDNRMILLDMRG
jgi:hypothetical protein